MTRTTTSRVPKRVSTTSYRKETPASSYREAAPASRHGVGTMLLLVVVLGAMQTEALGFSSAAGTVRNLVAALLVLLLGVQAWSPTRRSGWLAMPVWLMCFAVWVLLRVVYDSGLSLIPLMVAAWFPFTFIIGYFGGGLSRRTLTVATWFCLVASGLYMLVALGDGVRGAAAINAILYPLLSLPFVLARGRGPLTFLAIAMLIMATLASEKRTAVIALVMAVVVALVAQAAASRRMRWKGVRLRTVFALVGAGVVAYPLVAAQGGVDVLAKFSRLAEDGGSGRDAILGQVVELILNLSLFPLLVGMGQDGVVHAIGISAHNDFLEVIYDFGLVGLFFLVMALLAGFGVLLRLVAAGSPMAGPMAGSLGLFLVMCMLSHVVFIPTYVALIAYFWGSVAAAGPRLSTEGPESAVAEPLADKEAREWRK